MCNFCADVVRERRMNLKKGLEDESELVLLQFTGRFGVRNKGDKGAKECMMTMLYDDAILAA